MVVLWTMNSFSRAKLLLEYFLSIMRHFREAIRKKRPEFQKDDSRVSHHSNASSHTALDRRDYFVKNPIHIVPQSPNSPNLALCDFCTFPKLEREYRFDWKDAG